MRYCLTIIAAFIVSACGDTQDLPQKPKVTWTEKKQEIQDSLATCETLQDSIVCINRFAYRDAIHGASHVNIDKIDPNNNSWKWSAKKFYQYFLKDSLTVYCGDHGHFNSALYRAFMGERVIPHGFSIGIPGKDIGHYINLLMIQESPPKLYLVDPMFNTIYTDQQGKLIDLREMIYCARKGRIKKYKLHYKIDQAQYLTENTSVKDDDAIYDLAYENYFMKSHNDISRYILKCPRTLQNYMDNKYASTYRKIADYYGYDTLSFNDAREFKYCVLFIKDIYGPYSGRIKNELRPFLQSDINRLDSLYSQQAKLKNRKRKQISTNR